MYQWVQNRCYPLLIVEAIIRYGCCDIMVYIAYHTDKVLQGVNSCPMFFMETEMLEFGKSKAIHKLDFAQPTLNINWLL